jgi:hypothetical protein
MQEFFRLFKFAEQQKAPALHKFVAMQCIFFSVHVVFGGMST